MVNEESSSLADLSKIRQQYQYTPLAAMNQLMNVAANVDGSLESLVGPGFDLETHNMLYHAIVGNPQTTKSVRAMETIIRSCMGHPTTKATIRALKAEGFEVSES